VVVIQTDVSEEEQVARVLEHIARALPPLRGVIHAAGTLDGVLLQQTWERFVKVMETVKEHGTCTPLTLRIYTWTFRSIFLSVAALLGSPGQGNYAAKLPLDASLASQRKSQGLPALSITQGPWASVGMAASLGSKGERQWTNQGISPLPTARNQGFGTADFTASFRSDRGHELIGQITKSLWERTSFTV